MGEEFSKAEIYQRFVRLHEAALLQHEALLLQQEVK
jgi:hypothetical protein